jgi:hypothetical protein
MIDQKSVIKLKEYFSQKSKKELTKFLVTNKVIFTEEEVVEKIHNLIKKMISNRLRVIAPMEIEAMYPEEYLRIFKEADISIEEFEIYLFELLFNKEEKFIQDKTVLIDRKIKVFKIKKTYFSITLDTIRNNTNKFLSVLSVPPKFYTEIKALKEEE